MSAEVLFSRLAPMPAAYPKPWFPMLPVLGRAGAGGERIAPGSRFLEPGVVFTVNGASAIYWALRSAGIGQGDYVAVPAYHCPTMVFPVLAAGAVPTLVSLTDDLALLPDAIAASSRPAPRAVLLPHFFGFKQPFLREIRDWCDANDAVLIEDCAHAFYGEGSGFVPGRLGHYAIASTRKFFPGCEGGALAVNEGAAVVPLGRPGLREELRGLADTLHMALRARNLFWQSLRTGLPASPESDGPRDEEAARREASSQPAAGVELAGSRANRVALRSAVALIQRTDHARSAAVRRARYRRWRDAIAQTRGVRAFSETMPDCGVPYVFAALLESPDAQYPRLKRSGTQVWRWDRLAASDCAVSRRLAVELVQLPCQHSGDDAAFEALVRSFQDAAGAR